MIIAAALVIALASCSRWRPGRAGRRRRRLRRLRRWRWGGGGGGGRGVGIYILIQLLIRIALLGHGLGALVLIGLALVYIFFTRVAPQAPRFWSATGQRGRQARRRVAQRQRRVETAAAVAAEEDEAFAPDVVKANATALFKQIQAAWDRGDRAALAQLVGAGPAGRMGAAAR